MEIYSAIKKNKKLQYSWNWNVALNEVTQTHEYKYSLCFSLMWDANILKLIKM